MKQQGKFIIYGYDSSQEILLGHYIACADGILINDSYKKSGLIRIEKLNDLTLKSTMFGDNT